MGTGVGLRQQRRKKESTPPTFPYLDLPQSTGGGEDSSTPASLTQSELSSVNYMATPM